ncbi:MAG: ATP-grasp domain-containing protein [Hydrogenophaga sp.]|jgi:3-methylcrotonyl-CoA carboxylase alpha subunit/geranyl-CoA carboxylase alpha subunit|uniref:acetyl/propionyl/methylcrotonyl-CoA carboxylase subunit alpha n=2 Tax=Hydrogenophaga sp. TaxID=1904254 RepID=UPI001E149606|nr:biotin carboxylase N-terminal domain-containing protein [Hydrogenophaga sp.]MBW0171637.1 ATP-grasp domain-containing protein [Hydrogenophaga sp.]
MKRLLIANRGEIARRIIRTAHAMGIETVAVFSEPDANALHVREATSAFALGGAASADSYLRVDRLLDAALATNADAVHPGYGFLSENADFAQTVIDAGLTWVGPPPAAIRALGSKSAAKALALAHGVPCLPGYFGDDQSEDTLLAEAQRVGFPLMVKAVAGGGGRGMRLVQEAAQLLPALRSARSEALAGFANGDLLIERALLRPRHVEVQVFADAHGHCVHLGERDCSVQRRHQKIVEEAPSPAVSPELREALGRCAVALAQAAGYVGAGTVEFLVEGAGLAGASTSSARTESGSALTEGGSALTEGGSVRTEKGAVGTVCGSGLAEKDSVGTESGSDLAEKGSRGTASPSVRPEPVEGLTHTSPFYLMEMNTRLQVEHPVTEALTGLDLVEWQLRVARGEPLPLAQEQISFRGHAIEVRLCAEDEHYTPHTGRVRHFAEPPLPSGLRFDHALETGAEVTPHYDAMLGKLIAHAPTRTEAIERLAHALDQTQVLGLPTNRAFLAACLRHPVFQGGGALIPFLADEGDTVRCMLQPPPDAVLAGVLAAAFAQAPQAALPCPFARPLRWQHAGHLLELAVHEQGQGALAVAVGERRVQARVAPGRVVIDGVTWPVVAVPLGAGHWQAQAGAHTLALADLSHAPRERAGGASAARELRAPFNGKLIAVHAVPGAAVAQGEPLLVIESMKLEHTLAAPRDLTVEAVAVVAGQQVSPGQRLITFAA